MSKIDQTSFVNVRSAKRQVGNIGLFHIGQVKLSINVSSDSPVGCEDKRQTTHQEANGTASLLVISAKTSLKEEVNQEERQSNAKFGKNTDFL